MAPDEEFHIEQHKALREEVMLHVSETRKLEVLTVGAVGALYAWVLSQDSVHHAIWWVPSVIVLLAAIRSVALLIRIQELGGYLVKIERFFTQTTISSGTLRGWENSRSKHLKRWVGPFANTATIFWSALLLATALIALLHPDLSKKHKEDSIRVSLDQPVITVPPFAAPHPPRVLDLQNVQ